MHRETEVRTNFRTTGKLVNLLYDVLELNSNGVEMIPDEHRATGIEIIIGLREVFSW